MLPWRFRPLVSPHSSFLVEFEFLISGFILGISESWREHHIASLHLFGWMSSVQSSLLERIAILRVRSKFGTWRQRGAHGKPTPVAGCSDFPESQCKRVQIATVHTDWWQFYQVSVLHVTACSANCTFECVRAGAGVRNRGLQRASTCTHLCIVGANSSLHTLDKTVISMAYCRNESVLFKSTATAYNLHILS